MHDRNDFELNQVRPFCCPALQQGDVVALHDLKAAAQVRRDPTINEGNPVRHQPAFFAKATVDRLGILIPKAFDNHEEHQQSLSLAGPPGLSQALVPKVTVAGTLHDRLRAREPYVSTKSLSRREVRAADQEESEFRLAQFLVELSVLA